MPTPSDDEKRRTAPVAAVILGAVVLFGAWQCVGAIADSPERPRPSPSEVREQEENRRIVEDACADWRAGYIELPDHQAQVCIDGGLGR